MTVERVDADVVGSPWREEHEARYLLASTRIGEGRVLDLACGTGFGSVLMLELSSIQLVAADAAEQAVKSTRDKVSRFGNRVEVRQEDATELSFQDGSFDAVVSFETIEHIADDEAFLSELARVLRPGGQLILSTPNALVTNPDGGTPQNRFHVREYTPRGLRELLENRFRIDEALGQCLPPRYGVAPFLPSFRTERLGVKGRINFLYWRLLLRLPPIRNSVHRRLTGCDFFPRRETYSFRGHDLMTSHVQLLVCTRI